MPFLYACSPPLSSPPPLPIAVDFAAAMGRIWASLALLVALLAADCCTAFYLPGVAPQDFSRASCWELSVPPRRGEAPRLSHLNLVAEHPE